MLRGRRATATLILVGLWVATAAWAQSDVKLEVLTPGPYQTGDPIGLKWSGPTQEPSDVVAEGKDQKSLEDLGWVLAEKNLDQSSVVVIPMRPGTAKTPPLALIFSDGSRISLPQVELKIEGATVKEPPPVQPPEVYPFPKWLLWVGLLVLAALIALAVWGVRRHRRSRRTPKVVAAGPVLTPRARALKALSRLNAGQAFDQKTWKIFAFGISDILKEFLGAQLGFEAMELTTFELLAQVEKKSAIGRSRSQAVFASLDLIKFTDHVPTAESLEDVLGRARSLVEEVG